MANKQMEITKYTEIESCLRIIKLMKRVEEFTEKTAVVSNKNIVAFVGPTQAGKSTLINCLLGMELKCKMNKDTEETFIIKVDESLGPKIGASGESETESPECCGNMPGTDFNMWDFAGFYDNEDIEQEIVNAISYQTILLAQNSVRFVLVAPFDMIKADDPLPFYKLLNDLRNICPEIAHSLCIVFTKYDKGNVKNLLKKVTSYTFKKAEHDNLEIINQGKNLIEMVIDNKNYIEFKTPKFEHEELFVEKVEKVNENKNYIEFETPKFEHEELFVEKVEKVNENKNYIEFETPKFEHEKLFVLPNKQQLIDCIAKLRGTKVKDFPLVISDHAKHVIAELYTLLYQTVKKEVENMNSSIEKFIQSKIDEILEAAEEEGKPTSAASKLANFKIGKKRIDKIIENSKDFKTFFVEVDKLGLGNKMICETIERFTFAEKLKNMYKMSSSEISSRGELEFFSNVKMALNSGAKKYSDLIANSTVATEEEKRKEREWENKYTDKVNTLQKQIENFKKDNDSAQVKLNQQLIEMANKHADEKRKEREDNDKVNQELKDMVNMYVDEKKELEKKIDDLTPKPKPKPKPEPKSESWCVISLVKDIDYNNPLLNKPLLLKSFSDLYGRKALSDLISLTAVLSEASSESVQEICCSPRALEMFATMIGFPKDS